MKILVATDFSADSRRALQPALELARAGGGKVHLVSGVVDPVLAGRNVSTIAGSTLPAEVAYAEDQMKAAAAEVPADLLGGAEVIKVGDPAEGLIEHAQAGGYDLLVLATHGRTGIRRMVLGSVAEAVLRGSHTPVLAIPPAEKAR